MKKITLAYFGTPDFSARFLEKLLNDQSIKRLVTIKLVVTQPDKPVGRKQVLTPSPVKEVARKYKISISESVNQGISDSKPVNQSNSLTDSLSPFNRLTDLLKNIDLAFLFAYGEIIPAEVLKTPKYGFWNIHPSLLPKYRGASPIAYPLILGDKKTGVTIIKMDEKLDHGPIIAQQDLKILPTDRRPDLERKLTDLAFEMFKKIILYQYGQGSALSLQLKPQNHKLATCTRLLKKDDGFIPLTAIKKALNNKYGQGSALSLQTLEELPIIIKEYSFKNPNNQNSKRFENWKLKIENSPKIIFDFFRGLYPWPGLWTFIRVNQLKIRENLPPQKRLKITDLDLVENKLIIKKVQLEGKKETDFVNFNRAYQVL